MSSCEATISVLTRSATTVGTNKETLSSRAGTLHSIFYYNNRSASIFFMMIFGQKIVHGNIKPILEQTYRRPGAVRLSGAHI